MKQSTTERRQLKWPEPQPPSRLCWLLKGLGQGRGFAEHSWTTAGQNSGCLIR